MRYFIFLVATILLLSACRTAPESSSSHAKRYPFKGKIVSVDKANKKASIDHEAVKDYMEAMTMDFPIHEDWVWDELVPGAEISAELVVDNAAKDPFWLEKIGIVAAPNPNQPAVPINENFVQVGKEVPDFAMTNQDGKRFTFKDYRGKVFAVTFIYRECPLPEYCIRMSKNFSDLAKIIADDAEAKDKYRLVSISFDPARDTPEKLKAYGKGYLGNSDKYDFSVWQLAVSPEKETRTIADFFGLQYQADETDKTQINHSLITAVIGSDGKVTKVFKGSEWDPGQLLGAMKSAN